MPCTPGRRRGVVPAPTAFHRRRHRCPAIARPAPPPNDPKIDGDTTGQERRNRSEPERIVITRQSSKIRIFFPSRNVGRPPYQCSSRTLSEGVPRPGNVVCLNDAVGGGAGPPPVAARVFNPSRTPCTREDASAAANPRLQSPRIGGTSPTWPAAA